MAKLIMTALGNDRPGLVVELTGHLHGAGANTLESRMVNVHGRVAVLMLLEADTAVVRQALAGVAERPQAAHGTGSRLRETQRRPGPGAGMTPVFTFPGEEPHGLQAHAGR